MTTAAFLAINIVVIIFGTTKASAQSPQAQWDVKDYQTLIAAGCAFIIGAFTVINAFISNYVSNKRFERDNKKDEVDKRSKQIAFFSILYADIDFIVHSLNLSKDVLNSIDDYEGSISNWIGYIKVAKNSIRFQPLTSEWDKIYIIGSNNVKMIRIFDLSMSSLEMSFTRALSMNGISSMPLFEKLSQEEEANRTLLTTRSLLDHVNEALQAARNLQIIATEMMGTDTICPGRLSHEAGL